MTQLTHSTIHHVAETGRRVFNRVAALIAGSILTVLGLAMTATIVMLPVGIVFGVLGVAIFLGGLFAPAFGAGQSGNR
jgi:hypothetical protein